MSKYLSLDWNFVVPTSSVIKTLREENVELAHQLDVARGISQDLDMRNESLKQQVSHMASRQLKEAEGSRGTRGKRRLSSESGEYSERHLRRLKRKRTQSCCASLAWMEEEGLKPMKVVIENHKTKKKEEKLDSW